MQPRRVDSNTTPGLRLRLPTPAPPDALHGSLSLRQDSLSPFLLAGGSPPSNSRMVEGQQLSSQPATVTTSSANDRSIGRSLPSSKAPLSSRAGRSTSAVMVQPEIVNKAAGGQAPVVEQSPKVPESSFTISATVSMVARSLWSLGMGSSLTEAGAGAGPSAPSNSPNNPQVRAGPPQRPVGPRRPMPPIIAPPTTDVSPNNIQSSGPSLAPSGIRKQETVLQISEGPFANARVRRSSHTQNYRTRPSSVPPPSVARYQLPRKPIELIVDKPLPPVNLGSIAQESDATLVDSVVESSSLDNHLTRQITSGPGRADRSPPTRLRELKRTRSTPEELIIESSVVPYANGVSLDSRTDRTISVSKQPPARMLSVPNTDASSLVSDSKEVHHLGKQVSWATPTSLQQWSDTNDESRTLSVPMRPRRERRRIPRLLSSSSIGSFSTFDGSAASSVVDHPMKGSTNASKPPLRWHEVHPEPATPKIGPDPALLKMADGELEEFELEEIESVTMDSSKGVTLAESELTVTSTTTAPAWAGRQCRPSTSAANYFSLGAPPRTNMETNVLPSSRPWWEQFYDIYDQGFRVKLELVEDNVRELEDDFEDAPSQVVFVQELPEEVGQEQDSPLNFENSFLTTNQMRGTPNVAAVGNFSTNTVGHEAAPPTEVGTPRLVEREPTDHHDTAHRPHRGLEKLQTPGEPASLFKSLHFQVVFALVILQALQGVMSLIGQTHYVELASSTTDEGARELSDNTDTSLQTAFTVMSIVFCLLAAALTFALCARLGSRSIRLNRDPLPKWFRIFVGAAASGMAALATASLCAAVSIGRRNGHDLRSRACVAGKEIGEVCGWIMAGTVAGFVSAVLWAISAVLWLRDGMKGV
ncbi:hypothetical protein DFJ73DRAFT_220081 [Zopfochytrium polystomum]|nr:hypothetical protein DFJ73DRAFT_220081 [Zopfochytrium polystomum]